jgi:3-oxoadipate enol-lactonase
MTLGHDLHGPGDAPVLVLPCSLGTNRRLWDRQLPDFTPSFRVLRYEHRGHGSSPASPGPYSIAELARDALELLDGLGLERVSWCGLSLGGMVGMWIGARAPERLDALVLASTAARMPAPVPFAERAALVRERGLEPVADAVVSRWFTPAAPPGLVQRFREILLATPVEGYAGGCEAVAAWDFRDELGSLAVPTLVLAGSEDEATPSDCTGLLAKQIPGARLVVLDGAAHLANLERPSEFAAAALSHLEAA